MNLEDLKELLRGGESLRLEFKERPVHPDDLAAALVAFANTQGGTLLLGVTDDRQIVGVPDPEAVARTVDNVAASNCQPPLRVMQEMIPLPEAGSPAVLVVSIPRGEERPYQTNRSVCYIRTATGRRAASREDLRRLFLATESFYYDETPLERLGMEAIDFHAVEHFLKETGRENLAIDPTRLLQNWRLVAGAHPTVAGLLFFGRDTQLHLPHAQINAARFPRDNMVDGPVDNKALEGQLLEVIKQAERFLDLHLFTRHVIEGFAPERKPELPPSALREAIVNAVAHRDYFIRGPIRLLVFSDRVEVHSPGRAPNSLTVEEMLAGAHLLRNPRIYARLADAGFTTRVGTGIPRMSEQVKAATGKELVIDLRPTETVLILPRAGNIAWEPA
jgi:ATP-dependent DNA helicase RecG